MRDRAAHRYGCRRQVMLFHETRTNSPSAAEGRYIAAVDLASSSEKTVIEDAAQPAFLANGDLLFLRGDALFASR